MARHAGNGDILQAVGSLVVYAVDILLMDRKRSWNYRTVRLSDASCDSAFRVEQRPHCNSGIEKERKEKHL